ncbi:helix-turn-helix transcriptional regulator [Pseudonocardia dioxanivorans]|uniref:helix-turn-helix transcriptional regulator n=1 Tax=Pseudonocardia dioxanivorans TaxID=240495 RepID=UPI000CCFD7B8|nr:helix-turn-helix domain-containing protein [Pseudonocardia dioxanivorans]
MSSPDLMTLDEVATELRVSRKTLLNWRAQGAGPKGFRLGRAVVFDRSDVRSWIDEQRAADHIGARSA